MATTGPIEHAKTLFPEEDQRWWRFTAYEVREGRIQPAPGAELQNYALSASQEVGGAGVGRAYEALVLALPKMATHESGWPVKRELSSDEQTKILGFCAAYGLLGLLHHQVRSVAFTPRERWLRSDDPALPVYTLPYQVRHTRTTRGWINTSRTLIPHDRPDPGELDLRHELVLEDQLTDEDDEPGVFEPPRALVQRLGSYDEEAAGLDEAWWPYFPSVASGEATTFPYPGPEDAQFWRMYAEPLDEFLRGAFLLTRVFEKIPVDTSSRTRAELDSLLAPVGLVVDPAAGSPPVQRLRAPSLLSALALEALSNAARGRRLVRCLACSGLFFSDNYQAAYCSSKHAKRMRMRKFRASEVQKQRKGRKGGKGRRGRA